MRRPAIALFDLGGVLLPFDQARRVRAVSEALRIDEAAARGAMPPELFARLDIGQATEADFAETFTAAAGREVTVEEALALILSVFEAPNTALWDIAARLRAHGPVGGFSDNPAFVRAVFPAGADLDPMFWSSELGAVKSGEAAFAAVEARLGVDPAAILFIDDSPGNIERARRRGWDAVLYGDHAVFMDEFSARGLL